MSLLSPFPCSPQPKDCFLLSFLSHKGECFFQVCPQLIRTILGWGGGLGPLGEEGREVWERTRGQRSGGGGEIQV